MEDKPILKLVSIEPDGDVWHQLTFEAEGLEEKESLRVQVHGRFHSHRLEEYITIEEIKEEALNKARRLLGNLCNHESG